MVQRGKTTEIMMEILKNIIGRKVEQLFLIVWPPYGESDILNIDISIGFIFENFPNELLKISTDKNELTKPTVEYISIPERHFNWKDFDIRMKLWLHGVEGMEMDNEYYNVSNVVFFRDIVDQKILDIELVGIRKQAPFGIKFLFDKDFILSTPISDGNTIETGLFHKSENIEKFTTLGEIEYVSLKSINRFYD
jgi:hypothetical protein